MASNLYFTGQGTCLLAALDNTTGLPGGFRPIGNANRVTLALGQYATQYATAGSYTLPPLRRSGEIPSCDIGMESWQPENLSLVLYGDSATVTGATVTNEAVIGYLGGTTPLANIMVAAVVVKNSALSTTYTLGTDYTVNADAGSITVLSGGAITNAQALKVSYTFTSYSSVGGYTTQPGFYAVRFEGLNNLQNNSPCIVDLFKVRFLALETLDLISDKVEEIPLKGHLHRDPNQSSASTHGQMIRIRQLIVP